MRLVGEDDAYILTGYGHIGISPFGMHSEIPMILCEGIVTRLRPRFVWMGGGHEDWKLGMSVRKFLEAMNALVLDVREPK